jgi:hypothetical protein
VLAALSAACILMGSGAFTAPDNGCTPGAYVRLSRAQVCSGAGDRTTLRASERRRLLGQYGVPNFNGDSGEIDHRVPVFLGGTTVEANLWPEPGPRPNRKDQLEFRVFRRVCFGDPHRMRVRTARRIFLSDWRHAYRPIVLGQGPLDAALAGKGRSA